MPRNHLVNLVHWLEIDLAGNRSGQVGLHDKLLSTQSHPNSKHFLQLAQLLNYFSLLHTTRLMLRALEASGCLSTASLGLEVRAPQFLRVFHCSFLSWNPQVTTSLRQKYAIGILHSIHKHMEHTCSRFPKSVSYKLPFITEY